jgi:hypothetical protein
MLLDRNKMALALLLVSGLALGGCATSMPEMHAAGPAADAQAGMPAAGAAANAQAGAPAAGAAASAQAGAPAAGATANAQAGVPAVIRADMPAAAPADTAAATPANAPDVDGYLPVHDLPPDRAEPELAPAERAKIEAELIAARDRQASAVATKNPASK